MAELLDRKAKLNHVALVCSGFEIANVKSHPLTIGHQGDELNFPRNALPNQTPSCTNDSNQPCIGSDTPVASAEEFILVGAP